ncbi:hypothetical protein D7241_02940 [Stutzerimonas sp. VN223-3]|uniref:hypothetical protein n=1 Tax=Stutzerimonas sp. VN223-3 TaxID=3384601 RepID=UPI0038B593A9
MFGRIIKVGLLAGCLIMAGTASASDRNVVVPVLAGAAVGAVLVAVLSKSDDDHHEYRQPRHAQHRPHARYHRAPPRVVNYRPKRVEYVMVPVERRDWRRGHR